MATRQTIIERLQALADAWPTATSLDDAFIRAGIKLNDVRAKQRLRRQAEQELGILLPPHNPKHSTEKDLRCPSTLDVAQAKKAKGFICASFTNNTTLMAKFLDTLELFSKAKGYQILVQPINYQNPNAMQKREAPVWHKRIIPYALEQDFHINSSIVFSSVSLQATSARPLAGKQVAYGRKSVIYGHNSLGLLPVATPKGEVAKHLFSTGSMNVSKYSDSDAGIKAYARHTLSVVLIVPVGNYYRDHIIEWDGAGFSFYGEYWTPEGLDAAPARYAGLHLGDFHTEGVTALMRKQRMRLIEHTNPDVIIWNDLHNHGSTSHHNTLIENMRRHINGTRDVRAEVQLSIDAVNEMGKGRKNAIIESNHHDHLGQWLNRCQPQNDIQNAAYYFWLMDRVNTSAMRGESKTPLELAMEEGLEVDFIFVDGDRPYYVGGIDCSQHGHKGPDGARSAIGFQNVSCKMQTGHTHKRSITNGHWTSGVVPLELGYNKGLGTWSSTDTLITEEGTRTHVTFQKGKYW
jgi:hypothetical protein